MSRPMIPYAVQLQMAQERKDEAAVNAIIQRCFGGMNRELMEVAQRYDYVDLPFVLASMRLTAQSMTPIISVEGQQFVENLVKHITCVTVDADELRRQIENEEEKGT